MTKESAASVGKPIRIVIADDHPVVREGLAAMIQSQPDIKLVSEAANGQEAVEQYFQYHPDVILLDLRMPEMDGLEAARAILQRDAQAKVIMLTTYHTEEDVYQAMKAGSRGYLLKDSTRDQLVNAIRSVSSGRVHLSPQVSKQLAVGVFRERLTKRETEVMYLTATGRSNQEIAVALQITEGTVKLHLVHIFNKLGASSRTEAIRIALERGFVHLSN